MIQRQGEARRVDYIPHCKEEEFIVPLIKNEIEERIRFYCGKNNYKKVLDIGCGSQPFRVLFERFNISYFGFDVNEKQKVDFIGEIDKELNQDIINTGPYDFILCTEVLEHVVNWETTFANFYKLLNKGGVILITAPHFYPLHEVPYDFWRPTSYAFSHFAVKYNFKIIEIAQKGTFWDMLGSLLANTNTFAIKKDKITLKNRVIYRFFNWGSNYLFKVLKSRYLHNNIDVNCYVYQSNIVVLSK